MRRAGSYVWLRVWVVNADNYRGPAVATELRALEESELEHGGADIVAVVEATGNVLPHMPGMACEVGVGESRGNIAAYVRRDLLAGGKRIRGRWHDRHRTWPRTKGKGQHPARADLEVTNAGRVQLVFAHVPPKVPGATGARLESVEALVHLLAPWTRPGWPWLRALQKRARRRRPRLLLIDHNHVGEEIARRTGMTLVGGRVDALLVGGDIEVAGHDYVDAFELPAGSDGRPRRVPFAGDHHDVLRVVVRIHRKYLPTPNRKSEVPS